MMLLERWLVGAMLGFALTATAGIPGQSPTGKAQNKQPAKPTPELPPWDSAQPPPPIRPPSPDDEKPDNYPPLSSDDPTDASDAGQPGSADSTEKSKVAQPAPPADSAKQPAAAQPSSPGSPRTKNPRPRKPPNPHPPRFRHNTSQPRCSPFRRTRTTANGERYRPATGAVRGLEGGSR